MNQLSLVGTILATVSLVLAYTWLFFDDRQRELHKLRIQDSGDGETTTNQDVTTHKTNGEDEQQQRQ